MAISSQVLPEAAATVAFAQGSWPPPNQARFAELVAPWEQSAELACCRDPEGRIVAVNSVFSRKFGYPAASLFGTPLSELLHPDDIVDWRRAVAEAVKPPYRTRHEHRWRTAQGWRWISWEETLLFDQEGRGFASRAIGRDVTKRRVAEEQCYRLASAVEQSPISILITDLQGHVQYVNPKFTEVSGFTLEEIIEQNLELLRAGHEDEESYQDFWDTIHAHQEWRGELRTQRKNGQPLWESVKVSPIRNPAGEVIHLLSLREDITDRKQLEEQLRQAQKMEGLGTLAGGIAHDFNNMLAIINGYAEICLMRELGDERLRNHIREIHTAAQRASGLVRQILTFSRKAEVRFAPIALNPLVRELTALMTETFPRTIILDLDLAPELPDFQADQNQLQQIIMNLCVNARDAMPQGGRITLTTRIVAGADLGRALASSAESYVCLKVSDSGMGMSPEVRQRIFEPFFTTKQTCGGTGLGLSVVYGIIQSHQGFIDVESTQGRGSTFFVYLPLTAGKSGASTAVTDPGVVPRGRESILIVEDEQSLRSLLSAVLEHSGYKVAVAADGQKAIEFIQQSTENIDVVLLDLNMPRRHGVEVYKTIRQCRPNLKVIIVSGNISAEVKAELMQLGQTEFLHKPYRLDEIGMRLRRVLGR